MALSLGETSATQHQPGAPDDDGVPAHVKENYRSLVESGAAGSAETVAVNLERQAADAALVGYVRSLAAEERKNAHPTGVSKRHAGSKATAD